MERRIKKGHYEVSYVPENFVNPESYDPRWKDQKAWVILDHGTVVCILFAECYGSDVQDVLDTAVDSNRLDAFMVKDSDLEDYLTGHDSEGNPMYEGIAFLGNASEPFDLEGMDLWEIPASHFAEEPCLMTLDRVMTHLEDWLYEVQTKINRDITPETDDNQRLTLYQQREAYRDAITLARLMSAR